MRREREIAESVCVCVCVCVCVREREREKLKETPRIILSLNVLCVEVRQTIGG